MHVVQKRIIDLLYENKWTQKHLAQMAGVTEGTISRIVKGLSVPGSDVLGMIAGAFGVSADYLLGRTEDRRPADRRDEMEYIIGKTFRHCSLHDQMVILAAMAPYLSPDESRRLVDEYTKRRGDETSEIVIRIRKE